ncbi:MAG TPA: hypothetical protein PKG56_01975, partial [Chitinophagaceae bacterium]|nr:hypothetical protein [Chitinophagaceae bacterium]
MSMKSGIRFVMFFFTLTTLSVQAQRVRLSGALGGSAYYGDLIQGTPLLKQISPAVTLGGSYDLNEKLRVRASLSGLSVKADDKDNSNIKFKNRNLNFKSFIWEFAVA